jgi:hypothetical protein
MSASEHRHFSSRQAAARSWHGIWRIAIGRPCTSTALTAKLVRDGADGRAAPRSLKVSSLAGDRDFRRQTQFDAKVNTTGVSRASKSCLRSVLMPQGRCSSNVRRSRSWSASFLPQNRGDRNGRERITAPNAGL